MHNPEWKWVYVSLIAAGVFLVLAVIGNTMMDCLSGGCAVMFVSGFLVICGIVTTLLFFTRAREMDAILGERNLLARWTYPEEERRHNAEREYGEYRESNRALLYVIGAFILIAMVLMVVFGGEPGLITAGVLFVVFILCAIASVVAPRLERRRALGASSEAFITDTGIVYEGAVYPFRSFMMRMDGVRYVKETKKHPGLLAFSFIQLVGLFIPRPFEINVPVPPGEEGNAQRIAACLGGTATKEEEEPPEAPGGYCQDCGAPLIPGKGFCRSCGAPAGDD